MKKKNIIRAICLSLSFFCICGLCACGSESAYTEEQEDILANYMANLLLKYDENHKDEYNAMETTTEEPTTEATTRDIYAEEESTDEAGNVISETVNSNVVDGTKSLSDVLKLPQGLDAKYSGIEVTDIFADEEDDLFVMKAVENYKLLVVKFNVTNTTGEDIPLNTMEKISKFKGIVNDTKKYNAQLTLLLNALNTYEGTLPAGASKTMYLVYQTQLDSEADVKTLDIELTDTSDSKALVHLK